MLGKVCERFGQKSPISVMVRGSDAAGHAPLCRRLRVKLKHPTRDGARLLSILTNLPRKTVSALTVARLYRQRPLIIVMALFSI